MGSTVVELSVKRIQYRHTEGQSSHLTTNERVVETCCPEMKGLLAAGGKFILQPPDKNALRIYIDDTLLTSSYVDLVNPKHCIWCGARIEFRKVLY